MVPLQDLESPLVPLQELLKARQKVEVASITSRTNDTVGYTSIRNRTGRVFHINS